MRRVSKGESGHSGARRTKWATKKCNKIPVFASVFDTPQRYLAMEIQTHFLSVCACNTGGIFILQSAKWQ